MQASYNTDIASLVDSAEDELAEICERRGVAMQVFLATVNEAAQNGLMERLGYTEISCRMSHEITKRILAIIGDGRNASLLCWCLDFVAGTNVFGGKSEGEIGRRFGYTRANISRICRGLSMSLGIRSNGMRTERAVENYAERAARNHSEGKIKKPLAEWKGRTVLEQICNS